MSGAAISRLLSTGLNAGGSDPLGRVVGGEGVHFVFEDGRRAIDASNTGGPLGHGHPELVEAIRRAASAPVVNEGWHWAEREEAARELIDVAFAGETGWVGAVRFALSGSEANDLALSLCQAITGRAALATRERAYHGMAGLARSMTVQPHWHGGLSHLSGGVSPAPPATVVKQLPAPAGDHETLAGAEATLADVAAVIVDYTQGGIYYEPGYQDRVAQAARVAGALWIADEVVTGLGRSGRWFAFQGAGSRPDLVTLGKPLGGGAAPAGAVVLSQALVERLRDSSWQTFSTFRGHPLTAAAVRAHLRVVVREGLIERAAELDGFMERHLAEIAARHPSVERVDGRGLHWTVELHGPDWREWRADTGELPIASRVAAEALDAGALIGTSGEETSLFLAPPLVIGEADLLLVLEALDRGLAIADREVEAAG